LPRAKIMRQHPPRTAGAPAIVHRIQNPAHAGRVATALIAERQQVTDRAPLRIAEAAGIRLQSLTTTGIIRSGSR
jgi:hypothetical protein